jgi:hypothetical protein
MSDDKLHIDEELRQEVLRQIKPLEEAAFNAGKKAGIAEKHEALRESKEKSPEALAARARELQSKARAQGRELSNVESVRQAYVEAGLIPPGAAERKSPEALAVRARQIQVDALRDGRQVSNSDAVRAAYEESGTALE